MSQSHTFKTGQQHLFLLLSNLLFILLQISQVKNASGYMVGDNPYHRVERLDPKGKYQLEWKVDWNVKRVVFNVTVETRGYVGFGLSSNGKMTGADIVIGGVMPSGKWYFSDRHAVAQQMPELDPSQDWTLHQAKETASHTFLSFSRDFDTCDPQDYPINEQRISLIWSYGEKDDAISYHHRNRGEYPVYLLHPDYTPPIVKNAEVGAKNPSDSPASRQNKNLQIWTINTRQIIRAEDTTYWCTMHKAPTLPQKHHLVGFEIRFADEQSRRHVHHLVFHKCRAPRGRDANQMFASYLHQRGQLCFSVKAPLGPMPTEYCTEIYQVWGVGGRPFFYPPHVGSPFGESKDEYYVLQVHYDNPDKLANVQVDVSIDYYYTSKLRANDAAILVVRHDSPGVTPSLLVPPSSLDHKVYGMCGSECTREILPPEGIRAFGTILHAHNTAVAIRAQQFRGNKELPHIALDDNYAFNYQQIRVLNREVRIMPGDFIAARCTFDNTKVNGTTVGGYSSQQEMCGAWLYYYSRLRNYIQCSSEIESEEARERFLGIGNVTWSNRDLEFIVDEPHALAGLPVSQVSDYHVNWNAKRREEYQRYVLETEHVNRCPQELYSLVPPETGKLSSGRSENEGDGKLRMITFPHDAQPYIPSQSCSFQ